MKLTSVIIWILFTIFLSFFLIVNILHLPLNSDRIADYIIIKDLIHNPLSHFWFPPDNMFIKFFPNLLVYFIFNFSIKTYAISTFIQLFLFFILLTLFYKKLSNIIGIKNTFSFSLIIIFFILSTNINIFGFLSNPNARNIEIAISFWILFFLQKSYDYKKIKYKKTILLVTALFIVLLLFSDPFFLYSLFAPLLLYILFLFLIDKGFLHLKQIIYISSCIAIALVLRYFSNQIGFYSYSEQPIFALTDKIIPNLNIVINNILYTYGIDFFGNPINSIITLKSALNLYILILTLIGFGFLFKNKLLLSKKYLYFMLVLPLFNILIYIASNRPEVGQGSLKYLILLPFCTPLGLIYGIHIIKKYKKLYFFSLLILVASSIFFSKNLYDTFKTPDLTTLLQEKYDLIFALKREGLEYGYAEYWSAPINTFLSKDKIKFRQVTCTDNKIAQFKWVVKEKWYDPSIYKGKTFLILNRGTTGFDLYLGNCQEDKVLTQFGKPTKILKINSQTTVFIWNYNISSKFGPVRDVIVE